jgi:carbon monoxide dehydrogenase subunit G
MEAIARGMIEPLADGARSRVTITLDFEARGMVKLLVPLVVRRQARKQLPKNAQRLKERLERPRDRTSLDS